jgi:SAM-dependent methyltransferase
VSGETLFSTVDTLPGEVRRHVVAYLDAVARSPEISRVRASAWDVFAPSAGERLLDCGCGVGEVARQLGAAVAPDGAVTAVDVSADLINVARSRADGGPVRYATGDVHSLDFPDGCFDGVRIERVLQHVADPEAVIRELIRVTRPGGRICVIDTDWTSVVYDGVRHIAGAMQTLHDANIWRNPSSGRTARGHLVRAGLRGVSALPVTLRFTSSAEAALLIPPFAERGSGLGDVLSEGLDESWRESAREADERGDFLLAFTMWIVQGWVPL